MRLAAVLLGCGALLAAEEKDELLQQVLQVKRVCVDRLTGGETAAHIRDMLIASLQGSRLFIVTENQERADAFLRGSAEDLVFTDTFQTSEGVNARAGFSVSSGEYQRSVSSSRQGTSANVGFGESESTRIAERKHEASAAVRLVNKEGDVIWSTTQESLGGKFRGASADVADRIVKRLVEDYAKARKLSEKPTARPEPASALTRPR